MANKLPRIYKFNKPETWEEHLDDFENSCDTRGALTDDQKRGFLLESLDDTTKRNLREWLNTTRLRTKTFEEIKTKLNEKIAPAVNRIVRYSEFKARSQRFGESAAAFMADLKRLAAFCDFGGLLPRILMYQFVVGVNDEAVQTKLIAEHATLTATRALEVAEAAEESSSNVKAIRSKGTEEVHRVAFPTQGGPSQESAKPNRNLRCYRCGEKGHNAKKCPKPWKDFKCTKCGKDFHLAKACKAKTSPQSDPGSGGGPRSSRGQGHASTGAANYVSDAGNLADSDSDSEGLYHVRCTQTGEPPSDEVVIRSTMVNVTINGLQLKFEVDSGASRTLISYPTFKLLFPGELPPLYESRVKLVTWGSATSINTVGRFFANVVYGGVTKYLPVLVGDSPGPNLLGRNWFVPFGVGISLEGQHHVPEVSICQEDLRLDVSLEVAVQSYPAVSGEGTGCYKGPPIHLEVDPSVSPVYNRARRVPFALTTRMDEAIAANVEKGIWVPLKYAGPWASPIVPVQKASGALRLCADYSGTVNRAVSSDSYRTATREEICAGLAGGKFFAEIDLQDAYTQVCIDDVSSRILAVNTVKGLFRVTRLPFGIKVAPPIFQRVIDGLVGGLRGTVSYQDNIYVAAEDPVQLRQRLFTVLRVLSDAGLKVNRKKCVWQAESLTVLGFRLDAEGIHPLEERVAAIKGAPSPTCKQELQSLLGLIGFYDCFFRNKSTILEPLHRLLDAGAPWRWSEEHQTALQMVKDVISSDQVLTHYTLRAPLILTCDASPVGVGALISHVLPTGESRAGRPVNVEKPIAFGSRTLSKTERRYAQIEREALAIRYGVKKFSQYLSGRKFTIVTDRKPLLGIFKPGRPISESLSPRLLRFALHLTSSDYEIVHKAGKAIGHADFLSRLPVEAPEEPDEYPDPVGVHLLDARDVEGLSADEISRRTKEDPVLHRICQWTKNGWPESPEQISEEARPYYRKRDELSLRQGCLLWRDRVVIPERLRPRVLAIIHATHQGETYCKAIARSLVWWPNVDVDVTNVVKLCAPCQVTASAPKRLTSPWPKATTPWERVHFDYCGPFLNRYFLVVVDSFSHWPVVKVVADLTAATLVTHTRYIFADFGKPFVVVTDNGAQFKSEQFESFLRKNGVKHLCTPPWHPASNGLAERTVQTVKRLMSRLQCGDVHAKVARALWAMRTTPSVGGRTPAEVLGRGFRTHLAQLHPDLQPVAEVSGRTALRRPGELVWALHHRLRGAEWEPGVITAVHGLRCYDVRLESGQLLENISADHLRLRFVLEQEDEETVRPTADAQPEDVAEPDAFMPPFAAQPGPSGLADRLDVSVSLPRATPPGPTHAEPVIAVAVQDAQGPGAREVSTTTAQPRASVEASTDAPPEVPAEAAASAAEQVEVAAPRVAAPADATRRRSADEPAVEVTADPLVERHQTSPSPRVVGTLPPPANEVSSNFPPTNVAGEIPHYGFTAAERQTGADLAPGTSKIARAPSTTSVLRPARGRVRGVLPAGRPSTDRATRAGRPSRPPDRFSPQ